MFAIVAVSVRPNGAPMLSELAVQHCLGCHVRNVAECLNGAPVLSELAVQHCLGCHVRNVVVARMDGFKDVQRRIGN